MKKLIEISRPNIYYGSKFRSDLATLFEKYLYKNKKAILLTGISSFAQSGYYETLENILKDQSVDIVSEVKIGSNPELSKIEIHKDYIAPDIILCVGGGSVIDFGKALKLHFYKKAKIFVIYTLPGSSSIVTPFAILDNDEFKIGEHSKDIIPDCVYINDNILSKVPDKLKHIGVFDVFAHSIESYISKASTVESRKNTSTALRYLSKFIDSDFTDNEAFIYADIYAGLSEQIGLVLLPHAIGHYLTYKYKIPHGMATMYFLNNFIKMLQSRGVSIPVDYAVMLDHLDGLFVSEYKKPLVPTDIDIVESYKMIEKYLPFVFINNPVTLSRSDYLSLYK